MSSGSPLDDLLSSIENALHVQKRDVGGLLLPLEEALAAYRLAAETEAARAYCAAHSLAAPRGAVLSRALAAERLARAVAALPELGNALAPVEQPAVALPLRAGGESASGSEVEEVAEGLARKLPRLVRALAVGRLVIIGAFAGRTRTLPEPLASATDFIDTVRDGVHAVGNLPQRLRQGRIVGVIMCEQAISHQHSEPVVQAARAARIPVGFAGKGGNAALARALESLEAQLAD